MPIVTPAGCRPDDDDDLAWIDGAQAVRAAAGEALAVRVPNDLDPRSLAADLPRIALIAIPFPVFSDGRGFSLAKLLRGLGYTGRMRAEGHLIADQFAYALACGFDEVAISDELAARQPVEVWLRATRRHRPPLSARAVAGRQPAAVADGSV